MIEDDRPLLINEVKSGDCFDGVKLGFYEVELKKDDDGWKYVIIKPLMISDKND